MIIRETYNEPSVIFLVCHEKILMHSMNQAEKKAEASLILKIFSFSYVLYRK